MTTQPYQPVTTFGPGVRVCFSAVSDGSVAVGGGEPPTSTHLRATADFLSKHHFTLPETRIFVTYGPDRTYTDVTRVTSDNRGQSIPVDAIYTTEPAITMSVPVADCVATIVYDPVVRLLGVLHLGRHASVAGLIETFAAEVTQNTPTRPQDWQVWMSPSLQALENRLDYFDPPRPDEWRSFVATDEQGKIHVDVPAHNRQRFELLGVPPFQIYVSQIDTYTDSRYFSHRAATELDDSTRQGRMMVVAEMTEQREAAD